MDEHMTATKCRESWEQYCNSDEWQKACRILEAISEKYLRPLIEKAKEILHEKQG